MTLAALRVLHARLSVLMDALTHDLADAQTQLERGDMHAYNATLRAADERRRKIAQAVFP